VYQQLVTSSQTVSQKFYLQVFEHLREQLHHMRPDLFPDKWILHHQNIFSHTSLSVEEFLAKKSTVILLTHHTLILYDFFFFHTMMNPVKGPHFETKEEIHIAAVAPNNVQCTRQLLLEVL
jgi:hypothetical protein